MTAAPSHPSSGSQYEALPCPFCGSKPVVAAAGYATIHCRAEECFGPGTTAQYLTDALKQWNTRTPALPSGQAEVKGKLTPFTFIQLAFSQLKEHELRLVVESISKNLTNSVAVPTPQIAGGVRRWRHRKRGTVYSEIGRGLLQTADAGGLTDNELMVIYRNEETGAYWVRDAIEFEDGRFEALSPQAQAGETLPKPPSE